MSLYRQIENIKAQIVDAERLLAVVGGHPFMSVGLEEKLSELRFKLNHLPIVSSEPRIKLLFSGGAVVGSRGIKSNFISKTITPFQEMVKTQFAFVRFGIVGKRGQAKNAQNTELYLTSLPTGSFGVELCQLKGNDLFAEMDVATAIKQVIGLVVDAASSDEIFEQSLAKVPSRNLANLKRFLHEIMMEDSMLKMESGDVGIEIPMEQIKQAYDRVASATNEESELVLKGTLRGLLLDSERFEFQDEFGAKLSGSISPEISEEQLSHYKALINEECTVHLLLSVTKFKTGNDKSEYELLEII